MEICDQWKFPPLGGLPLGLDAVAVFAWLDVSGRKRRARTLWPQIRMMAAGALDYWCAQQEEANVSNDDPQSDY